MTVIAPRAPLTRQRVLTAALRYVDEHGLDALSMHKLGAELGVKAMSLYKHVANKDEILDGIVDELWTDMPVEPVTPGWKAAARGLAENLRSLVHRHPNTAALLTTRQVIAPTSLRVFEAHLRTMRADGMPEECAVGLVRTVIHYSLGFALAELTYPPADPDADELSQALAVTAALPAGTPEPLVRTAMLLCGECETTQDFTIGLDLMLKGMESYLAEPPETA